MDYIGEIVAIAINGTVFVYVLNRFWKQQHAVSMVQGAPLLEINKDLNDIIDTHPNKKLNYVAIKGAVVPIGPPVVSLSDKNIQGVIQLIKTREHLVQRSSAGFWTDHEKIIQEYKNVMPFALFANGINVEVVDALAAEVLDLDVVSDVFEPAAPTLLEHIYGFVTGMRQKGIQKSEHMLRTGTVITGIGELSKSYDGKTLKLQPSPNSPFYLTNMPVTSLLKKLEYQKKTYKWLAVLSGTLGIILAGLIVRRFYKNYKTSIEKRTRRNRRTQRSASNSSDFQLCVVCKENPKEIVLLPCAHVCLCEDCAEVITEKCPICRETIQSKTLVYIS